MCLVENPEDVVVPNEEPASVVEEPDSVTIVQESSELIEQEETTV
jgi:hypothetical protein